MTAFMTSSQMTAAALLFLSFVGILLTIYIRYKKVTKKPMVCPLNGHCEEVVNSQFSTFLGIPVELIGMAYYSLTAVAYALALTTPQAMSPLLLTVLFIATTGAFLFSLYLIFVQAFLLKQHCTWCLSSAGISTVMFGLSTYMSGGVVMVLLAQYPDILLSIYSLALALGVGSITLAAIFLLKFLADLKVAAWEADGLHTISQINWLALGTLLISGSLLYAMPLGAGSVRSFSMLQVVLLLIMAGVGAILDLLTVPKLIKLSSAPETLPTMGNLRLLRRVAFGSSAILLVTWYVTFVLGMATVQWPHKTVFLAYLGITLLAVFMSQIIEGRLVQQQPSSEPVS